MDRHARYSAEDARRELEEAIDRADDLGQAIAAQLAEAERELEEIRRTEALRAVDRTGGLRPIKS